MENQAPGSPTLDPLPASDLSADQGTLLPVVSDLKLQMDADSFVADAPCTELASHARIMIVDDEPINIKLVQKYLKEAQYHEFITTTEPMEALQLLHAHTPDILLLDIMMPKISGLEILSAIRADDSLAYFPILILTAVDDTDTRIEALELGATDFLTKPVDDTELIPRVRNALVVKAHHDYLASYARDLEEEVRVRTAQLAASRLELIHCLARAAEYRDNETGKHVIRVGRYAGVVARQLGMDEPFAELLEHAAPLHDMGKVGIPDAILLKPGKLCPEEFQFMQKHCGFGKRTFEPMTPEEWKAFQSHTLLGERITDLGTSPILDMAGKIALTHHEKWDGSGYPLGLAGKNIPIEGRITAVADVFDALTSKRPYKPAFPLDKSLAIMKEGRGTHFDPTVLDAFLAREADIVEIWIRHAELE